MRRLYLWSTAVLTAAIVAISAIAALPAATATGEPPGTFEFGLIGDTRYTAEQQSKFVNLQADLTPESWPSPSTTATSRPAPTPAPTVSFRTPSTSFRSSTTP